MRKSLVVLMVVMLGLFATGCSSMCSYHGKAPAAKVQRFGMVTGIKPEKIEYYKKLHANAWPAVNQMIRECKIRNFSIYLKKIGEQHYLFGYFEYVGTDLDADMKRMAADPETQRWWKETDPCQDPLPTAAAKGKIWDDLEEVYHLE